MSVDLLDNAVAVAYRLRGILDARLATHLDTLEAGEPYASAGISLADVDAVYAMAAPESAYGYSAFALVAPLSQSMTYLTAGDQRHVREDWVMRVFMTLSHLGDTADDSLWVSALYHYLYAGITSLEQWAREEGAGEGIDKLDFASSLPEPVLASDNGQATPPASRYTLMVEGTYRIDRRELLLLPTP